MNTQAYTSLNTTLNTPRKGLMNNFQTYSKVDTEQKIIKKLKQSRSEITIKPADKNLGIVIMNANDYIGQCMKLLSDVEVYRQTKSYPHEQIKENLTNLLVSFKPELFHFNSQLYEYLQPSTNFQVPQFYGLPKIHKQFQHLPPQDQSSHTVTHNSTRQQNF